MHGTDRDDPVCPVMQGVFRFRKQLFVDDLGWDLPSLGEAWGEGARDEERDGFDTADAIHCALYCESEVVGVFRAIRCDRPYLSRVVFPELAAGRAFPRRPDCFEISRFGVRETQRRLGPLLYAVMFHFGAERGARSLVATVDLGHERLLRRLGVRTDRYGLPQVIGRTVHGREILAVAGEIPLTRQDRATAARFDHLLSFVEISDETSVLGSRRLSA